MFKIIKLSSFEILYFCFTILIQSTKSIAEIPLLICSSGCISSEDKATAMKSEPLIIICDKSAKNIMPFNILM